MMSAWALLLILAAFSTACHGGATTHSELGCCARSPARPRLLLQLCSRLRGGSVLDSSAEAGNLKAQAEQKRRDKEAKEAKAAKKKKPPKKETA